MPTAYDICIKCSVIKPFFYLHFFFGLAYYNVQKKDKVAPLNLPLPFIWALLPFFPSGHLTHPPQGKERAVGGMAPGCSPLALPVALPRLLRFPGVTLPGR